MAKSKITDPASYPRYTAYNMKGMSESAIRKEYSRLRSVANKRLNRLSNQGIGMKARSGFKFPTIKEIEQKYYGDVGAALADVSKWLADPRSSVTGEKKFLKDFKDMMEQKGYGDLVSTPDKIYKTFTFLDEIRGTASNKLLPSGDALDAFQQTERLKIPMEKLLDNIDDFVSHLDELEQIEPSKGGKTFSKRRLNALIKKWK